MNWWIYALLSALFAALVSVLAKAGLRGIDADVSTALRTTVVLVFAWGIVLASGKFSQALQFSAKTWWFVIASGLATALSWLCYFRALSTGTVSGVVAVDRLSIVLAIAMAALFLGERIGWREGAATVLIVSGLLLLIQ